MTAHLGSLKRQAEELWAEPTLNYWAAARLASEITQKSAVPSLVQSAQQALPSLKAAAAPKADPYRLSVARRRFAAIRNELHILTGPTFGRRQGWTGSGVLPDALQRGLLGLPVSGPLSRSAVQAAFKSAAKLAHPDMGGRLESFQTIVKARDELLKSL